MIDEIKLRKIDDNKWMLLKYGNMKVPGIIYASSKMIEDIKMDESLKQVANVAQLPGIVKYSLAMPDIHWGYGFPIGGVAAFDVRNGIISPGGVGYDINCGVRLLTSDLERNEVERRIRELVDILFSNIPTGLGSKGVLKLTSKEEKMVLIEGAKWVVKKGYGFEEDLEKIEEGGCMEGANPSVISDRALERGRAQLGTVGSGNHFVEIGYVEEIFDEVAANVMGLHKDQITVLIHSGSRGFGHQVCDDYLKKMAHTVNSLKIDIPDRQLACAYINSKNGEDYYKAMICAINFAFANRQLISHWTREVFEKFFNISPKSLNMRLVYDVAHNIAKIEKHVVEGKEMELCVHRKGATRAYPPGHKNIPEIYKSIGQPVLIPGDMGRYSYVLVGTDKAMEETFGTTCHGAGRKLSRNQAKRKGKGRPLKRELEDKGIFVRSAGRETLAEEMPEAYKDVTDVVTVVDIAQISKKVAKLRPIGVIKG